jgi:hypothetical protein
VGYPEPSGTGENATYFNNLEKTSPGSKLFTGNVTYINTSAGGGFGKIHPDQSAPSDETWLGIITGSYALDFTHTIGDFGYVWFCDKAETDWGEENWLTKRTMDIGRFVLSDYGVAD